MRVIAIIVKIIAIHLNKKLCKIRKMMKMSQGGRMIMRIMATIVSYMIIEFHRYTKSRTGVYEVCKRKSNCWCVKYLSRRAKK
jgi:hypothetical protein